MNAPFMNGSAPLAQNLTDAGTHKRSPKLWLSVVAQLWPSSDISLRSLVIAAWIYAQMVEVADALIGDTGALVKRRVPSGAFRS